MFLRPTCLSSLRPLSCAFTPFPSRQLTRFLLRPSMSPFSSPEYSSLNASPTSLFIIYPGRWVFPLLFPLFFPSLHLLLYLLAEGMLNFFKPRSRAGSLVSTCGPYVLPLDMSVFRVSREGYRPFFFLYLFLPPFPPVALHRQVFPTPTRLSLK